MENFKKSFKIYQIVFVLIFLLFVINTNTSLAVWDPPTTNPPTGNVMAPLNQGLTPQFKEGGLHIGDSTTMGGYLFSVSNGASYFEDLEVGGKATITASTGGIETKGNVILQGSHLLINDSGTITTSGAGGQVFINNNSIDIIGTSLTSILVNNDNGGVDSIAISADANNDGTAILGSTGSGIGVFGSAVSFGGIGVVGSTTNAGGLAGRFDGEVRFNSFDGLSFTDIGGGTATFTGNSGRTVIIEPPDIIAMGDIKTTGGDIIVEIGDIEVHSGEIDMFIHNIINVADPVADLDATNKQYVDAQIGGSTFWSASGNDIYNTNTANVGIGTEIPGSKLTVDSGGTSPGVNSSMLDTSAGIGDTRLLYNNGTNNYGLYVDMFSAGVNYAAAFMDGAVGIGTANPSSDLHIYSTGAGIGETDLNLEYDFTGTPNGNVNSNWTLRATSVGGKFHILDSLATERLTIDSVGNVGIGTAMPSTELEVVGDATIQGDLIIVTDAFIVQGGLDVVGDIIVDGGVTVGDDITVGTNKIKKTSASDSPSIEFDSNNNIVITIPGEEIIIE